MFYYSDTNTQTEQIQPIISKVNGGVEGVTGRFALKQNRLKQLKVKPDYKVFG